jgi:UDP-N-acetylmuramoyl-L-alanyl-D-glutamate--2,6-diaminopimelate ligase
MRLRELIKGIVVTGISGGLDTEITSVVYDSRKASPGSLFTAVKGMKDDGSVYIGKALDAGARAVVSEGYAGDRPEGVTFITTPDARRAMALTAAAFYGYPATKLSLVGITGTNGKTTTSYLVRAVLESTGAGVGLLGTISYEVGGRKLPAPNTTPESVDLQEYLARMRDAGAKYAVLEVSSHSVSLQRVAGCEFKVRVFTNFTQDHLDFHGDMESYYEAKKGFFTEGPGACVINMDDPKGADLAASAGGRVLTYGIDKKADVYADGITLGPDGMEFTIVTGAGRARIKSPLVGRHNAYNILAASAACIALGMDLDDVAKGIGSMRDVPGRFERVEAGQDFTVLVDYAHTEDALERAMAAVREFTPGRLITLFGCGGDRDKTKRPKMGRAAARMSDIVVLTSDNPRTEDPVKILDEVESGVIDEGSKKKGATYFVIPDRNEAICLAVRMARSGDTVLLAGKGHEDYQIVGTTKAHFDDREAAREAIIQVLGDRG